MMRTLRLVESKSAKQLYVEKVRTACEQIPLEDPMLTALGRERIQRTLDLLKRHIDVQSQRIVDLGCGIGTLSQALVQQGAEVTAVDAAPCIADQRIEAIPYLAFDDACFDGVIFTDVIAHIEPALHRLTFSELSRLLTRQGWLLVSTPLDIHSLDAAEQFIQLIETEFEIIDHRASYHRLAKGRRSHRLLLSLESLSKILWGQWGMTHLIILARKKRIL